MVLRRRVPLLTQITGLTGQLGAVAAAVPMTHALSGLGWTTTYLVAAGVGVLLAVALALVVHDAPDRVVVAGPKVSPADVVATAAGRLGRARHPARAVDALQHPVRRHRARAAVGLPVPGPW